MLLQLWVCIYPHSHTRQVASSTWRPTCPSEIHSHTFAHWCTTIGGNAGFSVFPKDTSARRPEEPGIEPPIFWLGDDATLPLSHSRPSKEINITLCVCCIYNILTTLRSGSFFFNEKLPLFKPNISFSPSTKLHWRNQQFYLAGHVSCSAPVV